MDSEAAEVVQAGAMDEWLTEAEIKRIWLSCKSIDNEAFCVEFARAVLAAAQPKQPNTELPHLTSHSGRDATARDAARYHWLSARLLAADFAWGDPPQPALVFAWPKDVAVGGNCDMNIDAAMRAGGSQK
jgi:hypothetical protein